MSPDEKEILYIRWIYPNEEAESGFFEGGYLWCYDLSTGSASRVFPEQEYMSAKWSPNGDCFGFLREFPPYGDWTRAKLEAYYPASQEHKTLLQEVFNCSIKWSPDGRKLYYYGSDGIGFVDLSNLSISQVVYDKDSCSDEDYIANLQFIDERSLAFSESNQEDYQMGEQYYVTTILDLETRKSTRLPLLDVCFLGDAEMYWLINEWDESSLYGWTDIMKLVVNGDTINEIDGGHDVSWIPGGKEDGADQPS
jgi:dipeptidyl aminopeptidase/acylaminoacyl peptidase